VNTYTSFPPIEIQGFQGYTCFPPPQAPEPVKVNDKNQIIDNSPSVKQMEQQIVTEQQPQVGKELDLRIMKFFETERGKKIKNQVESFPDENVDLTKDSLRYGFSRVSPLENYLENNEFQNEEDPNKKTQRIRLRHRLKIRSNV